MIGRPIDGTAIIPCSTTSYTQEEDECWQGGGGGRRRRGGGLGEVTDGVSAYSPG